MHRHSLTEASSKKCPHPGMRDYVITGTDTVIKYEGKERKNMKAVKKLLTCVLSATLLFGSATAVFAADSKSAAQVTSETSGITVVNDVTEVTESISKTDEQAAEVITKTQQDPQSLVDNLKGTDSKGAQEAAKELEGKTILTPFFDIQKIGNVAKDADGKYDVKLSVPELTDEVVSVQILHYSTERGTWEVLDAEFDLATKTIIGKFQDLSPATIAVVLKTKTPANNAGNANATATGSKTASGSNAATGTKTSVSGTATSSTSTSPVTGVSTNYAGWLLAALVTTAAGVSLMFRRKKA